MESFGNSKILKNYKYAFFCSRFCPPEKITKIYDWAINSREQGTTIISGFHTPIEQDVLKYLLKGNQPIIICPARCLKDFKIPTNVKKAFYENRILFLSPFSDNLKRQTKQTAILRNEFVIKYSDEIVIGHAENGGIIDSLIKKYANNRINLI